MNLGNALRSMHRLEEALEEQRAALPLFQKVADANPGVPEKLQDLALCHWHIGHTLERLERPAEALAAYEQALSIRRAVAKAHATVTAYQDSVAGSLIEFGLYRARLGRFDEALANFDEAVAIRRQVADADAGSEAAGKLSYGYADRGWAKFRAGRPAEAAADLRQAVEMWGREKPRSDWFSQYRQVRAFSTLAALAADPRSGVSAAEAAGFADRAVAALPKTVDSLWLGRMKDPEYDPIRDRPEFQKWFREQEAKLPKPVVPAPPPREKQ
jgi:tetratricopeptide (TPR) repeat protein